MKMASSPRDSHVLHTSTPGASAEMSPVLTHCSLASVWNTVLELNKGVFMEWWERLSPTFWNITVEMRLLLGLLESREPQVHVSFLNGKLSEMPPHISRTDFQRKKNKSSNANTLFWGTFQWWLNKSFGRGLIIEKVSSLGIHMGCRWC